MWSKYASLFDIQHWSDTIHSRWLFMFIHVHILISYNAWKSYEPVMNIIIALSKEGIKQNLEVFSKTKIWSIHHDLEFWESHTITCLDIMTNAVNRPTNRMTFNVSVNYESHGHIHSQVIAHRRFSASKVLWPWPLMN